MKTSLRSAALVIFSTLLASTAFAETWNQPAAASTYKWFDPANWNPASVPNGVGADANIAEAGNTRTVSLQGAVTLGSIEYNITGIRSFVIAKGAAASADADFNGDGVIDAADYVALRKGGTLLNDPNPGN